MDKLSTFVR